VENEKISNNCTPDEGDTRKLPPSGGPLVVTVKLNVDTPHEREKANVDCGGKDLDGNTRYSVFVKGPRSAVETGTTEIAERLTDGKFTDQKALHEDAAASATVAPIVTGKSRLMFCRADDEEAPSVIKGASDLTMAISTDA